MGKSRYNDYWYNVVMTMIKHYPSIKEEKTLQAGIYTIAIEKAIEETLRMSDGDLRMQAITLRFFEKTHTIEGVAAKLYVSPKTVDRWSSHFVRLVAHNAGY